MCNLRRVKESARLDFRISLQFSNLGLNYKMSSDRAGAEVYIPERRFDTLLGYRQKVGISFTFYTMYTIYSSLTHKCSLGLETQQ